VSHTAQFLGSASIERKKPMDKFLATTIKTANEVYDAVAKARKEGYNEGFEDGRREERIRCKAQPVEKLWYCVLYEYDSDGNFSSDIVFFKTKEDAVACNDTYYAYDDHGYGNVRYVEVEKIGDKL